MSIRNLGYQGLSLCSFIAHGYNPCLNFRHSYTQMKINMLEYKNILSSQDKEVRDPVSGYSYPMSLNDIHAQREQVKLDKQESQLASMLTSIIK